ncbi:MAG: TonB-dependent receptor [Rhizobiaceae bacterium]|nr:TonB-dependent receptor [Rhizobiaceae bacterium]
MLATALPAKAQQTDKQGRVTSLQRLVIGAGEDKVAIDTPQSVTVTNQEDLNDEQPQSAGEMLRDIPGVNTSGSDRLLGQTFNIRGIGAPESANEEGRIIITVDGANKFYEQYRMGGLFTEPELFKQVEVLRGPASSTLYGSGAIGGVINFTTKDASDFIDDGQSGSLRLKGGFNSNVNSWLGSALLAQRLGENAGFLIAGNYRKSAPYVTGAGTVVPSSDFSAWSGLAKGTFKVGDEGTLRASYQHWDSNAVNQDYAQVGTQAAFGTVDRHVVDKTAVVSYENPFSENDWIDLKIAASFSGTTVRQSNASGIPAGTFGPGTPATTCANNILFCNTTYGYQTWQFDVRNTAEWHGGNWDNYLTFGWQTAYQMRTAQPTTVAGAAGAINFHPEGTDFKTGLYVQNEFIWDDRLTIIPGIRVDWRTLTPGARTGITTPSSDLAFSPKIAAHYRFNENIAVFGSIAHTERFPVLDEVFSTGGSGSTFLPSLNLRKERANNYELGFALSGYDLVQTGDAAQLKVTGFFNDVRDLIDNNPAIRSSRGGPPVVNNLPGYVNIGRAQIYGFEIEGAYEAEYLFARAGYSYVVGRDVATGAFLTSIAPHEFGLTVGGKIPEHDLRFGWKARFVAAPQDPARRSAATLPTGTSATSRHALAFNVHDVFLSWTPGQGTFKGWEAHLGVDNVFNANYKEFLHNDFAKGRTYKVSLSKQIGWN